MDAREFRDAVEEANATFPVATEAISYLDRRFAGGRSAVATRSPSSRLAYALGGLYLRAGMLDAAEALLLPDPPPKPAEATDAVLIDPNYRRVGGHYHQADRFYLDMIKRVGLDFTFLHSEVREAHDGTSAPPHLTKLVPKRLFRGRASLDDVMALNRLYAAQFDRAMPRTAPRLIVVPTPMDAFIDGIAQHIARVKRTGPISLLLGLHEPSWARPVGNRVVKIYQRAFARLDGLPDLRVMVVAESEPIAEGFRLKIGGDHSVTASAWVGGYADDLGSPRAKAGDDVVVGFVGRDIPQRGGHLVPEIASKTLSARPQLRWRAQLKSKAVDQPGRARPELRALADSRRFDLIPNGISNADYYDLVRSIDIMVMPFDRSYIARASGVASECLRLGCVMIAPAGSTMAAFAADHGAGYVTFAEQSPEAIAAAVLEAADRIAELRAHSLAAARRFTDRNETIAKIEEFIAAA